MAPPCHGPLGGLDLSGSSPSALIRSLLPGPPARTHWPRCIAHCLDSPGLGRRKEEVPRCRPPQGRASDPGEHFPSVSSLLYACPASSLGTCGTGRCHPRCSAEGGALCLDQGAQLSPPACHPSRALGCLPSAANEHWKETGKVQ